MAMLMAFVLFLAYPLYAVATVLCAFLVFAAAGSWLTERWQKKMANSRYAILAVMVMGAFAPLPGHPPGLFQALIHLPNATKIIISVTLIAPMAVYMGMPFPVGMMRLAYAAQDTIPWAWVINGCASVVGAALATLLAIHLGFSVAVLDLRFSLCCLAGV